MAKKIISELSPKLQVEALLFSSGKTMSEEQLATLTALAPLAVRSALLALQKEYDERDGAICVFNDPTGWKMMVRDKYISIVKNIVADTELSRACLETLAVIAYKYPKAIQSEVIDVRGSGAYDHMAELERLGFIAREPSGRSYMVKLTEKFFNYFDVAGGKDIREVFKNVRIPKREQGQKTLGDLQVVDVPKDDKNKPVELVETPLDEQAGEQEPSPEEPTNPEAAPTSSNESNDFLDDLDRRIANLTEKNDTHDKDETLKRRPLPGMEESETENVGEDSETEAEESDNQK